MASAVKAKGRPPGAKNIERPVTTAAVPRCPNHGCLSTRQEPGAKRPIKESNREGVKDGEPYNKIVWYRTICADCGQHYGFNVFLFEPDRKPEPRPERPKLVEHREVHPEFFKQEALARRFADGPHELTDGGQRWQYGRHDRRGLLKAKVT